MPLQQPFPLKDRHALNLLEILNFILNFKYSKTEMIRYRIEKSTKNNKSMHSNKLKDIKPILLHLINCHPLQLPKHLFVTCATSLSNATSETPLSTHLSQIAGASLSSQFPIFSRIFIAGKYLHSSTPA